MLTKKQIEERLAVLADYEFSCHCNTWDEPERVTEELIRVLNTRSRLMAMLNEAKE